MAVDFLDFSSGNPLSSFQYAIESARQEFDKAPPNAYSPAQFTNEIMDRIVPFFDQSGMILPDHEKNLLPVEGTTHGYHLIRQLFLKHGKPLQDKGIQPVFLMITPTYKAFVGYAKENGFSVEAIQREQNKDWKVDPDLLEKKIVEINADPSRRVAAIYLCGPNSITGTIDTPQEMRAMAKVIVRQNSMLEEMDKTKRYVWSDNSPFSRMRIIQDMVYIGTEYQGHSTTSFAHLPETAADTFVLAGCSKIGLPKSRTAVLVCDEKFRNQIFQMAISAGLSMRDDALYEIAARFSMSPEDVEARYEHCERVNNLYRYNSLLLKALVNGIEDTNASPSEKQQFVDMVSRCRQISLKQAENVLRAGLSPLKVVTTPEAGFHDLISFKGLTGWKVKEPVPGGSINQIASEQEVADVLQKQAVETRWGSDVCLPREDMLAFVTLAVMPERIVEFASRLERLLDDVSPTLRAKPLPQPAQKWVQPVP